MISPYRPIPETNAATGEEIKSIDALSKGPLTIEDYLMPGIFPQPAGEQHQIEMMRLFTSRTADRIPAYSGWLSDALEKGEANPCRYPTAHRRIAAKPPESFSPIWMNVFRKLTEQNDDWPLILDTIASLVAAFSCHTPG